MRSHAFGSRRLSRPSLSSASARHSSAPSIGQSSRPSSRPGTNSGSTYSASGTIAPRRPVVYMDAPSTSSDFVWKGAHLNGRPSTALPAHPLSKATSLSNSHEDHLDLSFTLSPEIELGMGDLPGYIKIPVYTPRSIRRRQSCVPIEPDRPTLTPVPAAPGAIGDDSQRIGIHSELKNSNPAISDVSFASLQGQTSTQSQLGREAMIQEPESGVESHQGAGGRERLSRVLCSAWSERATRRRQR